jgi:hypothetical protein
MRERLDGVDETWDASIVGLLRMIDAHTSVDEHLKVGAVIDPVKEKVSVPP